VQALLRNFIRYVLLSSWPSPRTEAGTRHKPHGRARILKIAVYGTVAVCGVVVVAISAVDLIEEFQWVGTEGKITLIVFRCFGQKLVDEWLTIRIAQQVCDPFAKSAGLISC